jgi:hypothetical protein
VQVRRRQPFKPKTICRRVLGQSEHGGFALDTDRECLTDDWISIGDRHRLDSSHVRYRAHPSVYSALLCLRQVVRRKTFLINRFGYHKGATDGWGKPSTVIVDNGWEFVGMRSARCPVSHSADVDRAHGRGAPRAVLLHQIWWA